MKLSLKSILITWGILFLVVVGLFFSAYSRLKPESLITLVKEQVEKNYPGSALNVGSVEYSMAMDFTLLMKNLTLNRSGNTLGSIGSLEMKIPWWLLLLNRGAGHINLSDLEIYVDHDSGKKPDPVKQASQKNSHSVRVVLPGYLADSRFTIKAKNVSLRDAHSSRRFIRLSKLLVREFQYGKNSAFEVNIPVEITHRGAEYSSELWLFGDMTPEKSSWAMNFRGEFRSKEAEKFQMDDLIIDGKATLDPAHMNIRSTLKLLVEKEEVGTGEFSANDEDFKVDVKLNKFPLSFFEIIKEEIKNQFLDDISGEATGSISISKSVSQEVAQVRGKIDFDGTIHLGNIDIPGKWKLTADGTKWETSFISPKGEVSFFRRSIVDFSKGTVAQYNEEIGFSGVDLQQATHPLLSLGHLMSDPAIVYFNSTISLKKCLWNKKAFSGEVKYGISPDQRFYLANVTSEDSDLHLTYQEKNLIHQIAISAKNFPLFDQFKLFDPFLTASQGNFTGKLEGKWAKVWQDGTWISTMDINGTEKLKGSLPEISSKAATEFSLEITPDMSWSAQFRNDVLTLTSLMIEGSDPARITGSVSENPKNKSFLLLSYPKNRTWKPVRKELSSPLWSLKETP